MSTTTIRLPDALKARVAAAAKETGTTAHSFIIEAIAEKADDLERRGAFQAEAEARYASIVETGKAIPWSDMRAYLERRVSDAKAKRPTAKKLVRNT